MNQTRKFILFVLLFFGFASNSFIEASELSNQEFVNKYNDLEEILSTSDVITPTTWREEITPTIKSIETLGSQTQIQKTQALLTQYDDVVDNTISSMALSFFHDVDTQELMSQVAIGTLVGALPLVALTALSVTAGNVEPSAIVTTLVDVGTLSALDSLIRYFVKQRTGELETAGLAAIGSTGMVNLGKNEISNLSQMFGKRKTFTQSNPISSALLAMATEKAMQTVNNNGGFGPLLRSFDWKEFAVGSFPETKNDLAIIDPAYHSFYEQAKQQLSRVINNREVKQAAAQVITYALEGVVVGGISYTLGLSYSDETTLLTTLGYSMLRGGIEGLARYSLKKLPMSGMLQRVGTGFVGRQIQKTIMYGTNLLDVASTDITPIIIKPIISSAVNTIVKQNRGWKNVITNTLSYFGRGQRGNN